MSRDIASTWPQTRSLQSYLNTLALAAEHGEVINYRVARLPQWDDAIEDHGFRSWPYGIETPRCFMVHSGFVRGWVEVLGACRREEGEVDGWPAGLYIVRDPVWHPMATEAKMVGFRGWRWVTDVLSLRWTSP